MNTTTYPVSPSSARPTAIHPTWGWPQFWDYVHTWMQEQEYAHSTARLYRQILRNFARVANTRPANVTRTHLDRYFSTLGRGHCSAHWTAINISTLRTIFDRVFGLELLAYRSGPRRPCQLPEILNHDEACALLNAATTLRDRLLIGLLYGCGLTVGEARRLQWRDLDPEKMTVEAPGNLQLRPRTVRLPDALLPLVQAAHAQCPPDSLVFPGSPRRSEAKKVPAGGGLPAGRRYYGASASCGVGAAVSGITLSGPWRRRPAGKPPARRRRSATA